MARRKQLRGSEREHDRAAAEHDKRRTKLLRSAMEAIRHGSCTKAYMDIAEMWEEGGKARAHSTTRSTIWEPTSELRELGYQFSTRCLRDDPLPLSSGRRKLSGLKGVLRASSPWPWVAALGGLILIGRR